MQDVAGSGPLKIVGWFVVALMIASMLYAGFMTLKYWAGIGV